LSLFFFSFGHHCCYPFLGHHINKKNQEKKGRKENQKNQKNIRRKSKKYISEKNISECQGNY
jgi:hypothetical protein